MAFSFFFHNIKRVSLILKDNIVALITPFNDDNSVNYNKIGELVEYHASCSVNGLLLLGTTGESSTLNKEEKEKIVEYVLDKNHGRMKIVVGVCTNNTKDAIEQASIFENMGADYLLVIAPYYNKTNCNGLYMHFKLISDSVNIPIILYNVPSRTGINLDVEVMKKLKKIPNIIGVKEANRDITHIMDVASICDETFGLYCGNDDLILLFLSLNAWGFINVIGNVEPTIINNLISLHKENPLLSYRYFFECYNFIKSFSLDINPIPIKSLMNHKGFKVGKCRMPLFDMIETGEAKMLLEYIIFKNNNI